MNTTRFRFVTLTLLTYLASLATSTLTAEANDRLLQLVGDNVGVVIEVDDLRTSRKSIADCEVVQRLQETEVFRRWKTKGDFQKLAVAQNVIEQIVGMPLGRFVDDVFGQSVVVAVYPRNVETSDVVLLTQAVSANALEEALDAWNRAERAETSQIDFGGTSFVRRTRNRDDKKPLPAQFYFRSENVLAFSNSEAEIRRVISLHTDSDQQSFVKSLTYRQARGLPARQLGSLYLNPRAWDDQVIQDADDSKAAKYLTSLWQRCDSIAFGLAIDEHGLVVNGTAQVRETDDPVDVSSVVSDDKYDDDNQTTQLVFLSQIPRRAVAFFAGKHKLADIAQLIMGWIPNKDLDDWNRIRSLGRGLLIGFDLFDDVLPAFGKNWGTYVVATQGERAKESPLDAVVGVELPPPGEMSRGKLTLRDALDNALQTTLRVVAKAPVGNTPNEPVDVVSTSQENGVDIRSVNVGNSVRAAYALTPRHLLAGTSPEALREFLSIRSEDTLDADPQFRAIAAQRFSHGGQLAFINAAALRKVISDNELLFSSRLSNTKAKTQANSIRRVRGLSDLLKSFDAAYLSSRHEGERLHLSAGFVVSPTLSE